MTRSETIAAFLKFLREADSDFNIAASRQEDAEQETQDILHRLELHSDRYHDCAQLALALRNVRRERREAKDERNIVEPISTWCRDNAEFVRKLERLLGDVRKAERQTGNRHYIERTDIISRTLPVRENKE